MKRVKKICMMLMLITVFVVSAFALAACDDTTPKEESAIGFTDGTPADAPAITASSLRSDFHLEIDASSFISGDAKAYTGVSAADAEAYVALYLASDSGWTLLTGEPLTFYKSETLVLVSFNQETGALAIVTANLKSGSVDKLKGKIDTVTYYYSVTNPAKTEYAWSEDLNLAGFAITRTGSDGSTKTLVKDTDYTIDTSSYDKNTAGYYYLPYRLIGSTDLSGNISVRVKERDIIEFTGGSASSFNQIYSDGIEGKLTVTPPTGVTEVTVSYRTKTTFSGEYGEWSATEPSLTTVGELFAEVKFSKDGYEDKVVHELSIRITARPFDNADSMSIADKTFDYDGTPKSVTAEFALPDGAKAEYRYGMGEWSETAPEFTNAGRYEVQFRVTKDTYLTVGEFFIIWINKTDVPDVAAPSMVHIVAGEALAFVLSGTQVGDIITYSTDNGTNYVQNIPTVTSMCDIKVKVVRGGGYESVFTVKVVYAPDSQVTGLTTSASVRNVSETDDYYLVLSSIQGGSWDDYYLIVRTSEDNGETWGNWIDVNYWYSENIPVYSADGVYKYNFRLINASGYKDFEYTLTLPYRYLTSLEVTTAPTQSNYMVGDTFNPDGIVVKKIYQDEHWEYASPDEYEFIDFDNNIITADTVLQEGQSQPIKVCIGDPTFMNSIKSELFRINVYDTTDMNLSGAVLRAKTLPKTVYNAGETFSLEGIVIETQIPTLFGERWIELPSSRYGIKDSDKPDMDGESQTVKVTAKHWNLDPEAMPNWISGVFTEFFITINYPFVGTTWYTVLDEPSAPLVAFLQLRFTDNENALLYDEDDPSVITDATYTAVKSDNSFDITLYVGGNAYCSYTYNPTLDTMFEDLIKLNSEDYILSFTVDTPIGAIPAIMVAVGGKLTAEQIDSFAAFGKFYLTEEVTSEGLITPETVFNADMAIYCIFETSDYTGAEFLGYYETDGMLLIINKNQISLLGASFYYTAEESEEQWTLTAGGVLYVYDKTTEQITATIEDTTIELDRLDESIYAIVTVVSEDEELSRYCMQYIVEKGKPFPSVKVEYGQITLMKFADYAGENISVNITAELTSATSTYGGMLTDSYIFGKYPEHFVFDINTLTVTMFEGLTEYDGTFEITDIDDDYIYVALMFDGINFDAKIETEYPYTMVLFDGVYVQSYSANDGEFYAGLPFLGEFTGGGGQNISLMADGNYFGTVGENWIQGRFEVTSFSNWVFALSFKADGGASMPVAGEYHIATRKLIYDGIEFDAPAVYVGRFTYQGIAIEIYSNGIVNGMVNGNVTDSVSEGNLITITVESWEDTITLIYDQSADTITYDDITYTKYNPVYRGQPFTNGEFSNPESESEWLSIDEEGNTRISGTVVGYISDFDEQERTFTVNYYDGVTPPASASYTNNAVTIGETTYSKPDEPELPFENAPFIGKPYINGEDELYIEPDGSVILNGEPYAMLFEFDEGEGQLTLVLRDESNVFGIYNSIGDSISIGGIDYTFIPKG